MASISRLINPKSRANLMAIEELHQALLNAEKAERASFSFQRKRIDLAVQRLESDPTNTKTQGRLIGLIFENYVLNLLTYVARRDQRVDWVCLPTDQQTSRRNLRPNRLQVDRYGDIVLTRGKHAFAQYDALVSWKGQIVVVEAKHTNQLGNVSKSGLISRLNKLSQPYGLVASLLLVLPSGSAVTQLDEEPSISILELFGFEDYISTFRTEYTKRFYGNKLHTYMNPSKVFGEEVDFDSVAVDVVKDAKELSPVEFWSKHSRSQYLGKVAIGTLHPSDLEDLLENPERLKEELQSGNPVVVYLRIDEGRLSLDLVVCRKARSGRFEKVFRKGKIRKSGGKWKVLGMRQLNSRSFYYWDARSAVDLGPMDDSLGDWLDRSNKLSK